MEERASCSIQLAPETPGGMPRSGISATRSYVGRLSGPETHFRQFATTGPKAVMMNAMREFRRREIRAEKGAARLPRHVEEFLGQVLRNRFHDTVLSPLPESMTKLLEAMRGGNDPDHPRGRE